MVMSSSVLANALAANPNVNNEATAITNFVNAWTNYFSTASSGAVPIVSPLLFGAPATAMSAAMVGLSQSGNGATAISNGITAWWGSCAALAVTLFPTAISLTPPPGLSAIAAALAPVFIANVQGQLPAATCYNNIATALHTINIAGGIAILLIANVPTPSPII